MKNRTYTKRLVGLVALCSLVFQISAHAEGSRNLYPADYNDEGPLASRANLDLQPGSSSSPNRYLGRVLRNGFKYVYAEAGEYILLGSSNIANGGNVLVYKPQNFGARGDETRPAVDDFSCRSGLNGADAGSDTGTHYFGSGRGQISNRDEELAGPISADGLTTVADGFVACAYQAPQTGIYGVQFTISTDPEDEQANNDRGEYFIFGSVDNVSPADNSVAAWDVTVRADAASTTDINGRLFTYAFIGFTAGNGRPIYSTLYYVTDDGYRYQQDLRGLDPNGYALYANRFGFFDNNEPIYKNIRASDALVTQGVPGGISTQRAQFPIFFSNPAEGGAGLAGAEQTLAALGIPLAPPLPEISDVMFTGTVSNAPVAGETTTGVGGTFSFVTNETVSYQIVISRGDDFDPANPENRLLAGIAFSGTHEVEWDGLDNKFEAFPPKEGAYTYRAYGRNGEVHFPIVDAENNGGTAVIGSGDPRVGIGYITAGSYEIPGGGPTITRLNGLGHPDTRVFFDDRGYTTLNGDTVGTLNGDLCSAANAPDAPDPAVDLLGVDSSSDYRLWEYGINRNRDCASDAGWGDAKGLNLWTYFLTGEIDEELVILPTEVDLGTAVTVAGTATAGSTVQGTFSFVNNGENDAGGVQWLMILNPGLDDVEFDNLPDGITAVYNPLFGDVTFDGPGFPDTMTPADDFTGMIFRYTAPETGPVEVRTEIITSDNDLVERNNTASALTNIGEVDVASQVIGLPATAPAGSTVSGTVRFSNLGSSDAQDVIYSITIGNTVDGVPADVQFNGLPPGVTVDFDPITGVATLTGMPDTLVVADLINIGFSYTAPLTDTGIVEVTSSISTSSVDANPANDADDAQTSFFFPDVDLASSIVLPESAEQGETVEGTFSFTNEGATRADGVTWALTLSPGLQDVVFPNLPAGVTADYDESTGIVTFNNAPTSMEPGDDFTGLIVRFTAPATGPVTGATVIGSTNTDVMPANNTADDSMTIPPTDVTSVISGLPATAEPNTTVGGTISFSNISTVNANEVSYTFSIGSAGNVPADVAFSNLPPGVTVDFDPATGLGSLVGAPGSLAPDQLLSFDFSYLAPAVEGAQVPVTSSISTSTTETDTDNNDDAGNTVFNFAPGSSIEVTAQSVCINDVPYIQYSIEAVGFVPNNLATLEFFGSDSSLVQTVPDLPLEGGLVLWPEAAVDSEGVGVAWPGWQVVDGEWFEIPSVVRPDVTARFSVNPSFEDTYSYPPATPACLSGPPLELRRGFTRAVPVLPLPWLLLMAGLFGGIAARQLRSRNQH